MSTQKLKSIFKELDATGASGTRRAVGYLPPHVPAESERPGFSGSCENTSLADWIQLVQMGRRDAVVSIVSHAGGEGRLWYRGGDIIDATCDGISGEDAVYRVLAWEGGKVSVDFASFERPRQIQVATAALLLQAAYRKDSGIRELARPPDDAAGDPSSSATAPAPTTASTPSSAASAPAAAALPLVALPTQRRRAGIAVLVCAAGLVGVVLLAQRPDPAAPTSAPVAAPAATAAQLRIQLEVEPAHAEIALNGKRVGVGQLNMTLPVAEQSHELLFSAPGYVAERLVFRDALARRRVVLARSQAEGPGPAAAAAELERDSAPPELARVASSPLPPALPGRPAAAAAVVSVATQRASVLQDAKLDAPLAETQHPRVQVIEDRKPRIEVIE